MHRNVVPLKPHLLLDPLHLAVDRGGVVQPPVHPVIRRILRIVGAFRDRAADRVSLIRSDERYALGLERLHGTPKHTERTPNHTERTASSHTDTRLVSRGTKYADREPRTDAEDHAAVAKK